MSARGFGGHAGHATREAPVNHPGGMATGRATSAPSRAKCWVFQGYERSALALRAHPAMSASDCSARNTVGRGTFQGIAPEHPDSERTGRSVIPSPRRLPRRSTRPLCMRARRASLTQVGERPEACSSADDDAVPWARRASSASGATVRGTVTHHGLIRHIYM